MVGDITNLDGFVWSPNNSNALGQIWDQLITLDEQLTPQPRLAESWDLSPDAKSIKFNLRKGVQWHSGRELTSDDVKYTLQRAQNPKTTFRTTVGPGADLWNGIDTPDKYTVVLKSDTPRANAFDSVLYLRILNKDVVEGPDAATKADGTSAFKFVEWVTGDHITLARNPNYWEKGLPYLDGMVAHVYKDQPGMVAALESGALDMAFAPSIQDASRLQSDPKYQVFNNEKLGQYFYLQLNANVPPTDNKLFRQAIAYSIDRKRFTDTIMKGFAGDPQALPWPPQSPASEPAKNNTYAFDLDKAKSLLGQSGVTNAAFELAYPLASFAGEYGSLAQIIQGDLDKIGVKVTLKPMDITAFTNAGITPSAQKPDYNGGRLNGAAFTNVTEPTSHFILGSTFGTAINASGYYDDAYKAMAASAASEPDAAKRKPIYSKINDYILDAAYCLVVSKYPNIMIQAANVRGLGYYPVLQWTLRSTWLA
ncbi:MAG: ABC transporter substrate-binding protein [Chloroflexi bacterium]|nr:ABC transporter substrate-binding protein [Chloroflexota bacterium]